MVLYALTKKEKYRFDIERTMRAWMPGGSVQYTPGGLAFRAYWGPLRYTGMFLNSESYLVSCLCAATHTSSDRRD